MVAVLVSSPPTVSADFFGDSVANVRPKSSRSIMPELDEFVHGATNMSSFAFDTLMAEYSQMREDKSMQVKVSTDTNK